MFFYMLCSQWFIWVRIQIRFLMFIQHFIKVYFFYLWCIRIYNFSIFVKSYRTTPNRDCLYNSYKDGDRCRGMLYFNERFQWYILCKKLLYMQRHFTHVLLHFLVKFKFIILFPFKRWPSRIFKKNCTATPFKIIVFFILKIVLKILLLKWLILFSL